MNAEQYIWHLLDFTRYLKKVDATSNHLKGTTPDGSSPMTPKAFEGLMQECIGDLESEFSFSWMSPTKPKQLVQSCQYPAFTSSPFRSLHDRKGLENTYNTAHN